MWMPFPITEDVRTRQGRYLAVVGRLKPGVTISQAQADMNLVAGRLEKEYPDFNANWGAHVVSLREQLSGEVRTALLVLS
jgi:hypothetical protein